MPQRLATSCRTCGDAIEVKSRGPLPLYCSVRCRSSASSRSAAAVESRSRLRCVQCGITFSGRKVTQRFCSVGCRTDHGNEKQAVQRSTRPCEACGNPVTHRTRRKLCERCRSEHAEIQRLRHIGHTHRRRLHPDAVWEPFDPKEVFDRDNWVCWICDASVDSESKWPDVMCPSLDHVIPLSRGGDHTMANARLAHFSCNSRRGNRASWTTSETDRSQAATG